MQLLQRPIRATNQILDRFYVISMEFLLLRRRRSLLAKRPSERLLFLQVTFFHSFFQLIYSIAMKGKSHTTAVHCLNHVFNLSFRQMLPSLLHCLTELRH